MNSQIEILFNVFKKSSKAGVSYTNDTNHPHAVTELSNGNTFSYDANGNMTQRVVNGQTINLGYDAENRLVSVTGTGLNVAISIYYYIKRRFSL